MADLPGLEAQWAALREWLDLGFHHRDLLTRLGASPGMGVLVTGASGSGKASLVEAVAASVGARLVQLWAPTLAATEPDAAARQLVEVLSRATREAPAVVLLVDVEAVAPREGAGPLLPVLLDAVRKTVADGRAAVVGTTSQPERVAPALREPGTLDHELAVPLPDRAQRAGCSRSRPAALRWPTTSTSTPSRRAARLRRGRRPRAGPRGRAYAPPHGSGTPTRRRRRGGPRPPRSRSCARRRWRARRSTSPA